MAVAGRMCSRLLRNVVLGRSGYIKNSASQRCQWHFLSTTAAETDSGQKSEEKAQQEEKPAEAATKAEEAFKEEKEKLTSVIEELQDKYKRALADTENVRQRLNKQIEDAKLFGIQGFCKDLLEVADILSKATSTVPEEVMNENPHLKNLYEGLTMTESQLQKVFTRHGLTQINPEEGEPFDPNIHEALFQAPQIEGRDPGTIAKVTKIGYRLHSRTLRPALVGVYKEC